MDYITWSDEYLTQAETIANLIEKKKKMLKSSTAEQRKSINRDIIELRNIYYDCMHIHDVLRRRAGVTANAA